MSKKENRAKVLAATFHAVTTSDGIASSGVVDAIGWASPLQVAAAIRALKVEGKIFQGGDRRFARYARTQALADKASAEARANPPKSVEKKKTAKKSVAKKRPAVAAAVASVTAAKQPAPKPKLNGNGNGNGNGAAASPAPAGDLMWLAGATDRLVVSVADLAVQAESVATCLGAVPAGPFREALAAAFLDQLRASSARMASATTAIKAMRSADAPAS